MHEFYTHKAVRFCRRDFYDLFGVHCTACTAIIESDGLCVSGRPYHAHCMKCGECGVGITTAMEVHTNDSALLCAPCAAKRTARESCAACGRAICGELVRADGSSFHTQCLRCHECGCELAGQLVQFEGHYYCLPDFETKRGIRCSTCSKAIIGPYLQHGSVALHPACTVCPGCGGAGSEARAMTVLQDKMWHDTCLKCAKCGKLLAPEEPIHMGTAGQLHCTACASVAP